MKILSIKLTDNGSKELSVIFDFGNGVLETFIVSDKSERFAEILQFVTAKDLTESENVEELLSMISKKIGIEKEIRESAVLSEVFSIKDNCLYYGDSILDETLVDYVLSLLDEKGNVSNEEKWEATIRFIDNLHQNTSEDVRSQLFRWLSQVMEEGSLTITKDGCFLGYKGCEGTILEPKSISTGTAYVNGEKYSGSIPNPVGAVVSMPRAKVTHDPKTGCSAGLHVGTYDYAHNFSKGVLLLVKVNPRDVVSVPYECNSQKLRCCEYKVLEVIEDPVARRIYEEFLLEEEEDWCEDVEDYENEYCEDECEKDQFPEKESLGDTLNRIQKIASSIQISPRQALFDKGLTGKIVRVAQVNGSILEGIVIETGFPGTVLVGGTVLFSGDALSVSVKE